ncbi:MFS transporter [Streptomyces sp. NPDC002851]
MSQNQPTPVATDSRRRRSMTGAFVGTAIEWYDFFLFGTAAALVLGPTFYPSAAPGTALLASFATFWVGFLTRPLGGVLFGHLGDRLGRKNTLVATLLLMGVSTTLIGVLPGYDTLGIAAPILLVVLRACQGLAVGGEWSGAVLMATENSSKDRRITAGSWVQQGSPAGSILATVMFLLVGLLPDAQFEAWGWRVPFLFSAVLVVVGLLIRRNLEESLDFQAAKARQEVVRAPVVEVFRSSSPLVLLGAASSIIGISAAFFNNTFLLAWTTEDLGLDRQHILNILLLMAVLQFVWQPFAASLAERYGALRVMVSGLVVNLLAVLPLFLAIQARSVVLIAAALAVTTIGVCAYYAILASFISGVFPARVRYSGAALANGICACVIGGSSPLIAQWILDSTGGSPWGVAAFYAALILATIAGVTALARRSRTAGEAVPTGPRVDKELHDAH